MARFTKTQARRAWLARAFGALGVVLSLVVWGCLNPWPDDYPSNQDIEVPEPPSGEDFCRDNPLAADCNDTGGNDISDDGNEPDMSQDPDDQTPTGVGQPGDAGSADAGSADAGAADAGAPDAGPPANK